MGLLINQGKQNLEANNAYGPIIQDNATMVIQEIKMNQYAVNTLNFTFRILDGENKNRYVYDRICYDPNDKNAWKYLSLRSSANVPYSASEPAQIDVEDLLLNRVVTADLGSREGKDREGNTKLYQSIKYKKTIITTEAYTPELVEEDSNGNLPFKSTSDVAVSEATQSKPQSDEPAVQVSQRPDDDDEW